MNRNLQSLKEQVYAYETRGELNGLSLSTMERYIRLIKEKDKTWYDSIKGEVDPIIEKVKEKGHFIKSEESNLATGSKQSEFYSFEVIQDVKRMAEICDIDLTIWEAERVSSQQWINNTDYPCWLFRVNWKRKKGINMGDVLEEIKKRSEGFTIEMPKVEKSKLIGDSMLEIAIYDLHLGRFSWGKETGESYDVKIAYEEWMRTHEFFYDQTLEEKVDSILFPIGNDFFNVDNNINTTTNGTLQHEDGRVQRSFSYGIQACVEAINLWRQRGTVYVPIVFGNHDEQRTQYLGATLEGIFRNTPDVIINNSPTFRKYHVYGRNLIGFSHGQKDLKRLPSVYQDEMREYLSQCDIVEWHVGHTHSEKLVEDYGNCKIRTIASLARKSSWETKMGYTGQRQAQLFKWNKRHGLTSTLYYNPEYFELDS